MFYLPELLPLSAVGVGAHTVNNLKTATFSPQSLLAKRTWFLVTELLLYHLN